MNTINSEHLIDCSNDDASHHVVHLVIAHLKKRIQTKTKHFLRQNDSKRFKWYEIRTIWNEITFGICRTFQSSIEMLFTCNDKKNNNNNKAHHTQTHTKSILVNIGFLSVSTETKWLIKLYVLCKLYWEIFWFVVYFRFIFTAVRFSTFSHEHMTPLSVAMYILIVSYW